MSLTLGTRLGPYEILAPLGAGGMGEVYRARDRKLDRDVAIKVLPQSVATDPDTLARFEREAKAVAALSHQNILAIHDFGNQDGIAYAVMELLEGETLRGKLDGAPISQRQAVDYALQVARGLSAAHEKGIVHRDLKPENLFISKDGHLKILDFGLAKRVETVAETGAPTRSGHTEPGTIMGTAGYMSPEQVKGLPVDHRSDIFSFGTILYELLSGKRAFKRATNAETMAAIMRDEPAELSESGRNISPALDRIVKHCLEKDRDHRFQSARDIAFNLLEQSSTSGTSGAREISPSIGSAGFWIAVLPFKSSGDAETESFADGLGEEITTGLSRFRYLSVVASASSARLKGEAGDERALGAKVGARYVLEGSIRQGGSAIRVSAQLVDAETGTRLWAETYNRDLQTSSKFAVQDDIAARIVATVADSYGVLVHSMRAAWRRKDDVDLAPVEWQFQYFAYREQITPSAHAALKSRLQRVLERDDRQSDLLACLAQIYVDEYAFGFSGDPTALDRALAAGRRAVELDRANQFALVALSQVHFFRRDLAAFGPAAERAMALNPLNTDAVGILGLQIVHTREFERGTAIVRRAMELNANHAGWMHFAPLWNHFHKGEYEQALECANRVDVPGLFWPYLVMAAACGHLGRRAEAEAAVRDLLALDPEFAAHARSNIESWHFASGLMEPLLDGLRKAGLEVSSAKGAAPGPDLARSSAADSGVARAEEGFWVAVLPFEYSGSNADLTALADGLSADIVTGLSRFSYLRVIARSSTSRYANEAVDVRSAGKELGARYVMEGNLRQAGAKLRLAIQLVDAVSGAHVWADNYERTFSPEAVFELQDDLVPRIVSTVADSHGVLLHSMSEALRSKSSDQLTPYEAVLRSFGYFSRVNAEELAAARSALELAVRKAPGYADAWAMLSLLCAQEYGQGYSLQADSLAVGSIAARRAVEAGPSNHLAHSGLAQVLFLQKEFQAFRNAAARAVALNPMDGATVALTGILLAYAGDWEHGCAVTEGAMRLNPNFPGWYRLATIVNAYRTRDYRAAIDAALRIQMPGYFWTPVFCAAAFGQLDEREAARKAVGELLAIRPGFGSAVREEFGKWHEPELVEHFIDGLRKAGLQIAPEEGAAATAPDFARSSATDSGAARAVEGFWVAVLPFKYSGADADLTALSEGLSEDVVTGLSRFSYLRVIARSSTSRLANEAVDVRSVGKELGARYVMEGTLRQAGAKLRLAVQLVDTVSGAHLWAENYERSFSPETVFELQDDLVPRIVSTVADMHGVLPRSMSEALRNRTPEQLSPYEAVLRSFGYFARVTAEELAAARSVLELALQAAPAHADSWAMLALLCVQDYAQGFNLQADSLASGSNAARRAVEAAPSNHLAYFSLAQALFFQKEFQSFRNAAERAVALNPMDGNSIAFLGELLVYAGDRERGLALAGRAKQLNPNHPGWYWYADFYDSYREGNYRAALSFARKSNLPGHWGMHAAVAAACAQLGDRAGAAKAVRDLLELRPDFAASVRTEFEKWWEPAYVESALDGLRKAGLEIAEEDKGTAAPALDRARSAAADSGVARAEEGFWVAVLPFKYTGTNPDLTALAEGLTEDIVTGLSRFSYLRVIARSSTARFESEAVDIRSAGKELGARYVMEGSLRQAGSALRVAVQLVDASTGAHLWAETYERTFRPEDIFALQDDLVPRIVSTVADWYGVLPHSMSESLRSKAPDHLSPYEAVLRSFGYYERMTAEEHAAVRAALERAVEQAPGNADCWAMLSMVYGEEYRYGFNAEPDPLGRSVQAARRAADAATSNHFAWLALAQALFYRKEFDAFRNAAERAIALNPMDGYTLARMGLSMAFLGDWEHGCELAERATQLNPNHPGWYWAASFNNAYRKGDYRGALSVTLKMNMPGFFFHHLNLAAVYGQLGEREAAGKALQELLVLKPDFALEARAEIGKFVNSELVEHLIDGLRKAGLDVPTAEGARAEAGALAGPGAGNDASSRPSKTAREATVSIAVLPFSDMSAAKDQEYLCEGMAEEIMNALVRTDGMRVASRTSAFRARQGGSDLPAIARALAVNHVLEGSVRTSGGRLRVTAQLTDVASGYQLWSERFDREAIDVFAIQDEIAAGVVNAVKARLGPRSRPVHARSQAHDLEAYRSYLKGRHLRGVEDFGGAIGAFEEAVRLEPAHAPSWTGLAEITVLAAHMGMIPPRAACTSARKMLATAKELQGESADGLHVEAFVAFLEFRWDAMEAAWRRAIELQPDHVLALGSFALSLCARQRLDEALPLFARAREADPLASFPYTLTGWGLLTCGKPEEGLRYLEDALTFEKEDASAICALSIANAALGRFDAGIEAGEHAVAVARRAPFFVGVLGCALAAAGRDGEARTVLEELRARPAASPTVVSEAWLLGALGQVDDAFDVLARAEEEHQGLLSYTGLPGFDSLRSEPRFASLMRRLDLSPA